MEGRKGDERMGVWILESSKVRNVPREESVGSDRSRRVTPLLRGCSLSAQLLNPSGTAMLDSISQDV